MNDDMRKGGQEIAIIDEESIRSKIYTIRGQQVMLDSDLAEIYGYTTKAFNQQVRNNIGKFDDDFRFQLTRDEVEELSRSKILTSMQTKGVKGGRAYSPYVFNESGIYMLMTILKGDLATQQSKALIRLFRRMKDYIIYTQPLLGQRELLQLAVQTNENTKAIYGLERQVDQIREEMSTKDDLEKFMANFSNAQLEKEYLFCDGQIVEAALAYAGIYGLAKKSIAIVDNYIGVKTLLYLKDVPASVPITIYSDNLGKKLTAAEFADFKREYPAVTMDLRQSLGKFHDRFILIDYGKKYEKIYHCGASSKDAGARTTVIAELRDVEMYRQVFDKLPSHPALELK